MGPATAKYRIALSCGHMGPATERYRIEVSFGHMGPEHHVTWTFESTDPEIRYYRSLIRLPYTCTHLVAVQCLSSSVKLHTSHLGKSLPSPGVPVRLQQLAPTHSQPQGSGNHKQRPCRPSHSQMPSPGRSTLGYLWKHIEPYLVIWGSTQKYSVSNVLAIFNKYKA